MNKTEAWLSWPEHLNVVEVPLSSPLTPGPRKRRIRETGFVIELVSALTT